MGIKRIKVSLKSIEKQIEILRKTTETDQKNQADYLKNNDFDAVDMSKKLIFNLNIELDQQLKNKAATEEKIKFITTEIAKQEQIIEKEEAKMKKQHKKLAAKMTQSRKNPSIHQRLKKALKDQKSSFKALEK